MQEKIFAMLMDEEEITWKTILYDLVKSEEMNPWDVNITLLTQKYLEIVKKLQEHDLKISGKILLAAAILLKIKSFYLVDNDIANLDKLINQTEEMSDEDILDLGDELENKKREKQSFQLIPRNPQPRNRKVSINDLVEALQKAMESKKRILAKQRPVKFQYSTNKIDIMEIINDIYHKLVYYTNKRNVSELTFTELLPPNAGRQEKVYTFLPLLHLENLHKVETKQKKPFDEIYVSLTPKKKAKTESA